MQVVEMEPADEMCFRCEEALTETTYIKGMNEWCSHCHNQYSSLQKRWKKNVALRNWYQNKTEEDKTIYFKEKRAEKSSIQQGRKRKFDEVVVERVESKSAHTNVDDMNLYIPFSEWCIPEKIMDSALTMKDLVFRWNKMLQDPLSEIIERQGETLVKKFKGVQVHRAPIDS